MIQIIPAIDIIEGQCVRLSQGDYGQCTVYAKSPLEMAKRLEDCGVRRLHLVDLDGARAQYPANLRVLEAIAAKTSLKVEFGGGIKTPEALKETLNAGADRIIGGSIACTRPELFASWLEQFGSSRIVLGADVKNRKVAIQGWQETTSLTLEALITRFKPNGLETVIVTDISKDGMLAGPSLSLYREIKTAFPEIGLIASGGISSMNDIIALEEIKIPEVIVGKAIYEGKITLDELTKMNS